MGDVEVKQKLAEAINKLLSPMRERRAELEKDQARIDSILRNGVSRGNEVANETLLRVKKAMKIDYNF